LLNESLKPCKKTATRVDSVLAGSPRHQSDENSNSITLSGLLNFTDGLWSCCGSERIFVFTTNHVEKLDPALLRSGRMDMHIFMSFCTFPALKILVKNYLRIDKHQLFPELEQVIEDARMTPADVSEILVKYRLNPTRALVELLETFKTAKEKPLGSWAREENPNPNPNLNPIEDEEQEKRALETPNKTQHHEDSLTSAVRCQCFRKQQNDNEIVKDNDAENLEKRNDQSGEQQGNADLKMQKSE